MATQERKTASTGPGEVKANHDPTDGASLHNGVEVIAAELVDPARPFQVVLGPQTGVIRGQDGTQE